MATTALRECDILHQSGAFWVAPAPNGKGFEVYRDGLTHATRVASIGNGPAPQLGIVRAVAECERRETARAAEAAASARIEADLARLAARR